jgi:hypothetical protein
MLGYCTKYHGNRDFHTLYATCIIGCTRAAAAYGARGSACSSPHALGASQLTTMGTSAACQCNSDFECRSLRGKPRPCAC